MNSGRGRGAFVAVMLTCAGCTDGEHGPGVAVFTVTSPIAGSESDSATGIVINEFATRLGPNDECGEFVELRNDTSRERSLGTWRIAASDARGNTVLYATIPVGMVIGPGCHLLIGTAPSGLVTDVASSCNLPDNGGLALMSPSGIIVDQVGMSTGSAFREGAPLAPFSATAIRHSYARDHRDTDDNAADFVFGLATPQTRFDNCATR